jgi:hypothetical protein
LGTVLLPAVESFHHGEHVIALGVRPEYAGGVPLEWADPAAHPTGGPAACSAVLVLTIPGEVRAVPPELFTGCVPMLGVELADGSPRGIEQGWRDRAVLLRLADSLDLALVSGSDNHGWGRAAQAWSVMRVAGWRRAAPATLDTAIRAAIRRERRGAVRVIARRVAWPGASRLALASTLPRVVWAVTTTLTWPERVVWIVWGWVPALVRLLESGWRARAALEDGGEELAA